MGWSDLAVTLPEVDGDRHVLAVTAAPYESRLAAEVLREGDGAELRRCLDTAIAWLQDARRMLSVGPRRV